MIRGIVAAAFVALVLTAAPASADDSVVVTPGSDNLLADLEVVRPGKPTPDANHGKTAVVAETRPPCNRVAAPAECREVQVCEPDPSAGGTHAIHLYSGVLIHGWPYGVLGTCEPTEAEAGPSLPALVLRAFREVPLPAPVLDIQPPKGKTLIGLETIFSTSAPSFTRQLTLLGQQVELKIQTTGFTWHYGDESTQTTTGPGIPWREGLSIDRYITHVYEETGTVRPSVEVTWSAEYRVNNGVWQPVNGTVTRAGAPQDLTIVEAEPRLVTG